MSTLHRITLTGTFLACCVFGVLMLTFISSQSEGPLSRALGGVASTVTSIEDSWVQRTRGEGRRSELAWFTARREQKAYLQAPDRVLLGAYDSGLPQSLDGIGELETALDQRLPLIHFSVRPMRDVKEDQRQVVQRVLLSGRVEPRARGRSHPAQALHRSLEPRLRGTRHRRGHRSSDPRLPRAPPRAGRRATRPGGRPDPERRKAARRVPGRRPRRPGESDGAVRRLGRRLPRQLRLPVDRHHRPAAGTLRRPLHGGHRELVSRDRRLRQLPLGAHPHSTERQLGDRSGNRRRLRIAQTGITWSTSVGYQQPLIGSTTLTLNLEEFAGATVHRGLEGFGAHEYDSLTSCCTTAFAAVVAAYPPSLGSRQQGLGETLRLSHQTIRNAMNGLTLSPRTLRKIREELPELYREYGEAGRRELTRRDVPYDQCTPAEKVRRLTYGLTTEQSRRLVDVVEAMFPYNTRI